jgi:hypothetical protein
VDIRIKISDEHLPAFLSYLGLGTLLAIRNGSVSPQTGIWTLARPRVWEFLLKKTKVPKQIIRVYQTADELSAIKELIPDEFDTKVGKLIDDLEKELAKMKDPDWVIDWEVERTPRPSRAAKARKRKHIPITKRIRNRRK